MGNNQNRVPPQSLDAEKAVLGCMLINNEAISSWWQKINEWKKIDCLSYQQSGESIKPQYANQRL